jgi:hypothetical protein
VHGTFADDEVIHRCIKSGPAWLVMSASCRGFFPPKTTDMPTCWRHVANTTQTMSATLHRVGSSDAVSVSCRHDDLPTCRRLVELRLSVFCVRVQRNTVIKKIDEEHTKR